MGQGAGQVGRLDHRVDVPEVGQRDRTGAHEGAVAGRAPRLRVEVRAGSPHGRGRRTAPSERLGQDGPRLHADVGRTIGVPTQEALGDALLRLCAAQVRACGCDLGDADGHLGVLAPLARGDAAEPAAEHLRLAAQGADAELVGHAERVAGGLADQDADGAVDLLWGQVHPAAPFLGKHRISRTWRKCGSSAGRRTDERVGHRPHDVAGVGPPAHLADLSLRARRRGGRWCRPLRTPAPTCPCRRARPSRRTTNLTPSQGREAGQRAAGQAALRLLPLLHTTCHAVHVRATVVLGIQGRLVVPAEARKELGLAAGDELVLHTEGGRLVIERREDAAKRLRGLYAGE
jgi:AbrB family looped-hinge helix DNA binding protein